MIATALAVLMFQQATGTITVGGSKGSSIRIHVTDADSSRGPDSTQKKNKKPRITATPEQIASAFADAGARTLLERARAARLSQDSSIISYDASTVQRFTLGVGLSRFGRERILFRNESAARVRWARSVGAQIDVKGRRSAAPAFGGQTDVDIEGALSPIPYYPGRDAFWLGFDVVKETETVDDVINPMSKYAEAYYTYRTGDSLSFRLPQGTVIQLRELEVRPRKADWHAVVGSLWFDVSSGQLVRAAFRMSQPIDFIDDDAGDDGEKPGPVARLFIPRTTGSIDAVAIEYGLYQGRFWLPRTETMEGRVTVGIARLGMSIEEHFTYGAINSLDTLPTIRERRASVEPPPPPAGTDSATARRLRRQFRDSVSAAREKAECDATGKRSYRTNRYDGTLSMMVYVPCDTAVLAHSPDLPGSLFDENDALFGDAERDELLARAKSLMPPVPLGWQPPTIAYGPDLQRYNRVEGLSLSVDVTEELAPATSLRFSPRIGTADRVFNGELAVQRLNGLGMRSLTVYRRLNASNDWGRPLSFGAGASAFLFGRDEGVYYRSTGAEVGGDNLFGRELTWRIFTEKQSDAAAKTNFSLPRALGSDGFGPRENIMAERIRESGAALRKVSSFGIDPNGFRLLSDLRLEGAGGDVDYGRGALDLTLSHPLGRALHRDFSAAVTAGAGTSVGDLPVQRYWYLGGTNSVRGQSIGAMAGSSYWLTRTEVGYGAAAFRRALFLDLGWAGDRHAWSEMGRPASGVGGGLSFLDGLVRMDLARGLYPAKQWNFALYLDARF
jgi:hypothetical protein